MKTQVHEKNEMLLQNWFLPIVIIRQDRYVIMKAQKTSLPCESFVGEQHTIVKLISKHWCKIKKITEKSVTWPRSKMTVVKEIQKNNGKKNLSSFFSLRQKKVFVRPLKFHGQKTFIIMFEHASIISENLSSCENYFLMSITKLNWKLLFTKY